MLPLLLLLAASRAASAHSAPAPFADADGAFVFGDARFSFTSAALVRAQRRPAGGGDFDMRPSLSMINSAVPPLAPVAVAASLVGASTLVLETAALRLAYNRSAAAGGGGSFAAPGALSVELLAPPYSTWTPGASEAGNLRGTRQDLGCYDSFDDCYSGGLGWGPLSRDGWAVWNDTSSLRMRPDGGAGGSGPWWDGRTTLLDDLYIFGHGLNYTAALRDLAAVSGGPPLPPAAAVGVWWSTWYDFSESEFEQVVLQQYAQRGLPLSAVVFDMASWPTELLAALPHSNSPCVISTIASLPCGPHSFSAHTGLARDGKPQCFVSGLGRLQLGFDAVP